MHERHQHAAVLGAFYPAAELYCCCFAAFCALLVQLQNIPLCNMSCAKRLATCHATTWLQRRHQLYVLTRACLQR